VDIDGTARPVWVDLAPSGFRGLGSILPGLAKVYFTTTNCSGPAYVGDSDPLTAVGVEGVVRGPSDHLRQISGEGTLVYFPSTSVETQVATQS
jgi:hypothetical protein